MLIGIGKGDVDDVEETGGGMDPGGVPCEAPCSPWALARRPWSDSELFTSWSAFSECLFSISTSYDVTEEDDRCKYEGFAPAAASAISSAMFTRSRGADRACLGEEDRVDGT